MKQNQSIIKPALLMLVMLLTALSIAPAAADDQAEWEVKGRLIGKNDKVSKDLSGIACATDSGFPRTCLVIDDELQSAQVVTLTEGKITAGPSIRLIDDMLNGKPMELDGEGVAFADGYFYVMGSHGRPRHDKDLPPAEEKARVAARIAASSKLIRLKFDAAKGVIATESTAPPSKALTKLIAAEPLLAPFRDKPLEEGGITIEGVAVRGQRLFAGFRGPTTDNGAVIVSAALGHFFDGKAAEAKVHLLPLGPGRGVRDLAVFDKGILILAGPMQSISGTYSVYWWDGASNSAKLLKDLPDYGRDKKGVLWKPEALLPLERNATGVRVLLLLDGPREGKPHTVQIPYP